jgi:acylphosphatase
VVDGRVQGVGFRQACAETARRLHLSGWVRNRRDGRVEAMFEGPPDAVARMVDWCRTGPLMASVTEIQVTDERAAGVSGFRVAATE